MCTLTVLPRGDEWIVTMNRDERRDRGEDGDLHRDGAAAYPRDAVTGGTWFGVNRCGLVLALLNRYDQPPEPTAPSRGRLIPEALAARTPDEVRAVLARLQSERENPFDLVIVSREGIERLTWTGRVSRRRSHPPSRPWFFTSSSERADEVGAYRERLFRAFVDTLPQHDRPSERGLLEARILEHFHLGTVPGHERASILMERETTHTKSVAQAVLAPDGVRLSYWPEEEIARHRHARVPAAALRPRTLRLRSGRVPVPSARE
ncbi:MAG: NRDE family protein [Longimicrobiales bacterium]|nr:NRDE family protein [Longimicrobiales bacterium]